MPNSADFNGVRTFVKLEFYCCYIAVRVRSNRHVSSIVNACDAS